MLFRSREKGGGEIEEGGSEKEDEKEISSSTHIFTVLRSEKVDANS